MIDIRTEHLLRVRELPQYLESRGLGKRVSMRAVNRWITQGCNGVRLEAIRIDKATLTSLEAVQRWVKQQSGATATSVAECATPSTATPSPDVSPEHEASLHLLTEHRVLQTELDRAIHALDHPESTRAFAAGVLFREGLRMPADARRKGLDQLLAIKGLGQRSREVVRSLWKVIKKGDPLSGPQHQP